THILTQQGIVEEPPSRLKAKRAYYLKRLLVRVGVAHCLAGDIRTAWGAWSEAVMRDPYVLKAPRLLFMATSILGSRMVRWSRRIRDSVMSAALGARP
ncbi:MAG TPA: hypothetical protein VEW91_05385, partial [bacterium]|nr:hypothetical protein [bacterium]